MLYKRSSQLFKTAKKYFPGGVNSPVRAFNSVGGNPIFVTHAKGAYLYDVDGNKYIDFISSWGPMILGHAHPEIINEIKNNIYKGTSYGIPTELETQIAKKAVSMAPNIDKIRFVNSGTEACMSAIRLARGYTGREKIIKFKGCYHGHADSFLIEAGSGAVTFGNPSSPGVTNGTAKDTILATYNDLSNVQEIFEKNKDEIAAIILEPVAGNMGCILPKKDFLEGLRELCDNNDSLLIFDEVMTGFRLAKGGVQELLSIKADIVTYGKVVGGGLPVGAFAAKNKIMNLLAPEGPIYQAGTLSGNPIAMIAGLTMLNLLDNNANVYTSLEEKTRFLALEMKNLLTEKGVPFQINHIGSMMSLHFTENPVVDFDGALSGNNSFFKKYFHGMLRNGIYLPPSAFESYFLNDSITKKDLEKTLESFAITLKSF